MDALEIEGLKFRSLCDLKDAVQAAYRGAEQEARASRCYKSRGRMLLTSDGSGSCKPCESGEGLPWNGSLKEINRIVEMVLTNDQYAKVQSISVYGGFDGAENMTELLTSGDYEPWIASWDVVVWERTAAQIKRTDEDDDERATDGPYKGHQFSCHIFACPGFNGCTRPPGSCDCDQAPEHERAV